jgi:hypothetical protein
MLIFPVNLNFNDNEKFILNSKVKEKSLMLIFPVNLNPFKVTIYIYIHVSYKLCIFNLCVIFEFCFCFSGSQEENMYNSLRTEKCLIAKFPKWRNAPMK